jgi:hypothetical protein
VTNRSFFVLQIKSRDENHVDLSLQCSDGSMYVRKITKGVDLPCISYTIQPSKTAVHYCKQCFQRKSDLDFTKTVDILGPKEGNEIVFVHGGGASRLMFKKHVQRLSKLGFRCILLDLPGHGSLKYIFIDFMEYNHCIKWHYAGLRKSFKKRLARL